MWAAAQTTAFESVRVSIQDLPGKGMEISPRSSIDHGVLIWALPCLINEVLSHSLD